jgi:hypothetical protein
MATARFPHGTKLYRGDKLSGTITYTEIGALTTVELPGYTVTDIDVTSHGSADFFREYLPGLTEGGNISGEIEFDHTDTQHRAIQDSETGRVKVNYKIELPFATGSTTKANVVWPGYINSFGPISAPMDDKYTAPISVKVAGKPTFTAEV